MAICTGTKAIYVKKSKIRAGILNKNLNPIRLVRKKYN
jgi:hypothetical protein